MENYLQTAKEGQTLYFWDFDCQKMHEVIVDWIGPHRLGCYNANINLVVNLNGTVSDWISAKPCVFFTPYQQEYNPPSECFVNTQLN